MTETSETRRTTPLLGDGKQVVTELKKLEATWCTLSAELVGQSLWYYYIT